MSLALTPVKAKFAICVNDVGINDEPAQTKSNSMSASTALMRCLSSIKHIREAEENFTPQMYQILMEIARQPGITLQGLVDATGTSLASISRNCMALGEWHRFGKPGLGMVEAVEDPHERRRKICFLTPKGRKFVEHHLNLLYPDEVIELDAPTSREWLNKAYRARR